MMRREEQDELIKVASAKFPATFGLRAFPGDTFRISGRSSFVGEGDQVVLYTEIEKCGDWLSFAKGSEQELRREMVDAPVKTLLEQVRCLHIKTPGLWIETDSDITKILSMRNVNDPQPHGGIWWRTHHLLRQLGGEA